MTLRKLPVDPRRYAPFLCVACGVELKPGRLHIILSPLSSLSDATPEEREETALLMACAACMGDRAAHRYLYPECDRRGCDLYDHAAILCANRTAATWWLFDHGRLIQGPTE